MESTSIPNASVYKEAKIEVPSKPESNQDLYVATLRNLDCLYAGKKFNGKKLRDC
jgi:hypothetical protein